MPPVRSELDFYLIDRISTFGDFLKLVFGLMGAFGPKAVADLLMAFDPSFVVDPETAGRWLRNKRRPSKEHLQLIIRLLQARGLISTPHAKDRLFIRIAALYVGIKMPKVKLLPPPGPGRMYFGRPSPLPPPAIVYDLRELFARNNLAEAMQLDLESPDGGLPTSKKCTPNSIWAQKEGFSHLMFQQSTVSAT